MSRWCKCRECGEEVYTGITYSFGSGNFCDDCANRLGLGELAVKVDNFCSEFNFCDPKEDLELYNRQLAFQDRIYDSFYYALKNKH